MLPIKGDIFLSIYFLSNIHVYTNIFVITPSWPIISACWCVSWPRLNNLVADIHCSLKHDLSDTIWDSRVHRPNHCHVNLHMSVKVCHVAGVVRESISRPQLASLPLLLMVLRPDGRHWLSVFIVCWLSLCWLARPGRATGQCLLLLSAWGSPSCPRTGPGYSNWYKVQRMPASSWCGAASSCGCTPKLVRKCEWVTVIYLCIYLYFS